MKKEAQKAVFAKMVGRRLKSIEHTGERKMTITFEDGSSLEIISWSGSGHIACTGYSEHPKQDALSFDALRAVDVARSEAEDGFNNPIDEWTPLEWAGALAGEAGEAANMAKKLRRGDYGKEGSSLYEAGCNGLVRELADTVIYADLCASRVNRDLGAAIREVFNEKSEKLKAPYKL